MPRSTSPKQFLAKIGLAVARWSPIGGAGFAFGSFLLRQEWSISLALFPITVVSGVWAAYSQSFLERLIERYGERGIADADRLVDGIDRLNDNLLERWRRSDFESQYLQCQAWDCEEDEAIGLRDDEDLPVNNPLLQEVFVPLELSADATLSGYEVNQLKKNDQDGETVTQIWDLLKLVTTNKNFRQIAIRAWGGYGKTTLMKHLAYSYSVGEYKKYNAPKFTPFLLYLAGCWQEMVKDNAPGLPELLETYHLQRLPQGKELEPPKNWANDLLKNDKAIVLFDGFDEVPPKERAKVSEWISGAMNDYRNSVFLLTSRPTAYKDDFVAKKPSTSFWVQDFNERQREQFVRQWYLCQEKTARGGRVTPKVQQIMETRTNDLLAQIKARPELNDIAGNVLLLNMMARFHRDRNQAELPQRKVELYQDICELQLGRRPKGKGVSLLLHSSAQRQEILETLALGMTLKTTSNKSIQQNIKYMTKTYALDLIEQHLNSKNIVLKAEVLLNQLVTISELLVEHDNSIYKFAHLNFQEFLTASKLAKIGREGEAVISVCVKTPEWSDVWRNVVVFYFSLTNPSEFIFEALKQNTELAYYIFTQLNTPITLTSDEINRFKNFEKSVKKVRYQKLEEYLQNKQWRDADQETYRLMITAVGKDEGQGLSEKDLQEFPCDELRVIDQLWIKYSNGLYGFSAQKDVYLRCGGTLNFEYPAEEVYEKFYEMVAWSERGIRKMEWDEILDQERMKKTGHLPLQGRMLRARLAFLASRIVECQSISENEKSL